MPHRDARCVYVARNLSEAETMVSLLASHDIEAKVIDGTSAGLLDGIEALTGSSSRGIEVWADVSNHPEVAKLLEEQASIIEEKSQTGRQHGPVEVVCESCGKTITFAGDLYGTIQDCPKCGSYVDVGPGEDVDWEAEVDEEMASEEEELTGEDNDSTEPRPA